MESGRFPLKGQTLPVNGQNIPAGTEETSLKREQKAVEGRTAQGQTVSVVQGDEAQTNIPRGKARFAGVKLQTRSVNSHVSHPGILNRIVSFFLNRPNASQRAELWSVYSHLEKALSTTSDNSAKSDVKSHYNGFTVNQGSDGHKVFALLVNAGLARFSGQEDGTVSIQFVRPSNFSQQVRATEALVQVCPIFIGSDGRLDWNAMILEEGASAPPGLATLECLKGDKTLPGDWYMGSVAIQELEELVSRREQMEAALDELKGTRKGENQWDTARRRMHELVVIANKAKVSGVAGQLGRSFISSISRMSGADWKESVDKLAKVHPRFGELLAQVTPDYGENLTADEPVRTPSRFYEAPSKKKMAEFLEDNGLTRIRVATDDVINAADRLHKRDSSPKFPLVQAYLESVQIKKSRELKAHFTALNLSQQNPVSLDRLQQGLGALKRYSNVMYERCVNDEQRSALLEEVKRKNSEFEPGVMELKALNEQLDVDADKQLRDLVSPFATQKPTEGEEGETVRDADLSHYRAIKIIQAYEAVLGLLRETGEPATLREMTAAAMSEAYENGEPLSPQDWEKGIKNIPLAPRAGSDTRSG